MFIAESMGLFVMISGVKHINDKSNQVKEGVPLSLQMFKKVASIVVEDMCRQNPRPGKYTL